MGRNGKCHFNDASKEVGARLSPRHVSPTPRTNAQPNLQHGYARPRRSGATCHGHKGRPTRRCQTSSKLQEQRKEAASNASWEDREHIQRGRRPAVCRHTESTPKARPTTHTAPPPAAGPSGLDPAGSSPTDEHSRRICATEAPPSRRRARTGGSARKGHRDHRCSAGRRASSRGPPRACHRLLPRARATSRAPPPAIASSHSRPPAIAALTAVAARPRPHCEHPAAAVRHTGFSRQHHPAMLRERGARGGWGAAAARVPPEPPLRATRACINNLGDRCYKMSAVCRSSGWVLAGAVAVYSRAWRIYNYDQIAV
ncbi:hypothetical protein BRADI_2g16875v3 [Brachypodium distachyon]|uniref:Uncharacterized protein n=1 Tax=Brachypodium distachyon TaxID=15368 RepID=A0A2K2D8W0_BRADI|nr:hypothetical protein BRADI_2g16875v3 [Brachypodium distachyon]